MKIKRSEYTPSGIIVYHDSNVAGYTEAEQRYIIAWLWKEKPEMVKGVIGGIDGF